MHTNPVDPVDTIPSSLKPPQEVVNKRGSKDNCQEEKVKSIWSRFIALFRKTEGEKCFEKCKKNLRAYKINPQIVVGYNPFKWIKRILLRKKAYKQIFRAIKYDIKVIENSSDLSAAVKRHIFKGLELLTWRDLFLTYLQIEEIQKKNIEEIQKKNTEEDLREWMEEAAFKTFSDIMSQMIKKDEQKKVGQNAEKENDICCWFVPFLKIKNKKAILKLEEEKSKMDEISVAIEKLKKKITQQKENFNFERESLENDFFKEIKKCDRYKNKNITNQFYCLCSLAFSDDEPIRINF